MIYKRTVEQMFIHGEDWGTANVQSIPGRRWRSRPGAWERVRRTPTRYHRKTTRRKRTQGYSVKQSANEPAVNATAYVPRKEGHSSNNDRNLRHCHNRGTSGTRDLRIHAYKCFATTTHFLTYLLQFLIAQFLIAKGAIIQMIPWDLLKGSTV